MTCGIAPTDKTNRRTSHVRHTFESGNPGPRMKPKPGLPLCAIFLSWELHMNKVLDRIFDFLAVVVSLILVFTTLSIGYAIFVRALNLPGPVWIVQFNEYAMLFATFLGSAWLLSKRKHVSIELIVSRFSRRGQKVFDLIHSLMGMGLCTILCWYGALTTVENFQRHVINVQAVDVPMAYIIFVIPLGFFFLFLQFTRNFFIGIHELRNLGSEGPASSGVADSAGSGARKKESKGGGN